jgi:hypothetical protein
MCFLHKQYIYGLMVSESDLNAEAYNLLNRHDLDLNKSYYKHINTIYLVFRK